MVRSFAPNITAEQDIWVLVYQDPPEINQGIKMEVGIEDCLHIEFEYSRSKYTASPCFLILTSHVLSLFLSLSPSFSYPLFRVLFLGTTLRTSSSGRFIFC